jgi:hypothetical protein
MAELLGIENLKKMVKLSLDLTEQIANSTADGWQWTDTLSFIDELAAIPGVVKSWKDVSLELKDLSPEEREELYTYVVDEFDLPNDKVELFVENALLQAISLISLVEQFKELKK